MAHFPMFINLDGRQVLIVGTGKHVQEKADKMSLFDCRLRFCSTEDFQESVLTPDTAMVILADRHHPKNAGIVELCHIHHIPVNAVDDPPLCDFQFPSIVCRGDLTIAVSTAGKAPAVGRLFRETLEEKIPTGTEEILTWSVELTQRLRTEIPDFHTRGQLLNRILREAFAKNRPLTEAELAKLF